MKTNNDKKKIVKQFTLPIYWRDEIKVWHGMVKDLKEAWRLNNEYTAGNATIQYWEVEL